MEEIPVESRVAISPLLRVVTGTRSRVMPNKQIGTLFSRQQHFIEFLRKIKLGNNVALKGYTLTTRNIIMACYVAHLSLGETLLCKTIKSSTISRYLSAAVELSTQANMMDQCLDIMGKQSDYIKGIFKELKRWENVPNRKEPVTKQMIEYVIEKGRNSYKTNPHNLYLALSNWLILGQQTGFRRKEWAQDRTYMKKHKDIERNINGTSSAFILNDFEFRNVGNRRINNSSVKEVNKASIVNIK